MENTSHRGYNPISEFKTPYTISNFKDITDAVKEFEKDPDFGKYDREIINRILN